MSHSPAPRRRPSAGLTRRAVGVLAAAAVVFSAGATAAQSSTNYLPVNWPPQVQLLDDRAGAQVEVLPHRSQDRRIVHHTRAERLDPDAGRLSHPDRVRKHELAACRQPGRHDVRGR